MRYLWIAFISLCLPLSVAANSSLLKTTSQAKQSERVLNQQREAEFIDQEQQLNALRKRLLARQVELQNSIDTLSEAFSHNENKLAETEQTLHLESGSLGELFGVVRQVAKELQVNSRHSTLLIGQQQNIALLDEIVNAKQLPSKTQLYGLWDNFLQQLQAGSQIAKLNVPFVQPDGVIVEKSVLRVGAFALLDEQGFLQWDGLENAAKPYPVQPQSAPTASSLNVAGDLYAFDPSQGQILQQLALKPTLMQRFEQGAGVGKVIVLLLLLGVLIGLVQGSFLLVSRAKITAQLKHSEKIGSNALGRILAVYKYDNSPNVEALELRLFEAILDEQHKLERGLSMLKLLAALAPMLGLLGTVTGMIETFQVITEYGNADPKVMAGGISMALVTTVLGLVAAMPLLFLHNVLNSLAENIRTVLEKQGVGLVAQRAEQQLPEAA